MTNSQFFNPINSQKTESSFFLTPEALSHHNTEKETTSVTCDWNRIKSKQADS